MSKGKPGQQPAGGYLRTHLSPSEAGDIPGTNEHADNLFRQLRTRQGELTVQNSELRHTRLELEESRDRYRYLFDSMPAGCIVLDDKAIILEANLAAGKLFGIDRMELVGVEFASLIAPDWRDKFFACRKEFSPDSGNECELKLLGRNGPFHAQLRETTGETANSCRQNLVTITDITGYKQSEDMMALAASEWQTTFDTMIERIAILDRDFRILRVNRAYAAAAKMEPEELTGKICYEVWRKEGKPCYGCPHLEVFDTGHPVVKELPWYADRCTEVTSSPILNSEGKVVAIVHVSRNVSKRRRAEEERERLLAHASELARTLERRGNTLQTIMENTDTNLAYLDRNFNFIMVNSAFVHSSGYTMEQLTGANYFALFPDNSDREIFERVRDTGIPVKSHEQPFKFTAQPWRGVTYWNRTLTPVKNESGEVQGLVLSLIDRTEHKQSKQLKEKLLKEIDEQRAKLAAIVQQMPVGLAIAEAPSGRIVFNNDHLKQIWKGSFYPASFAEYGFLKGFHKDGRPYKPEEWPLSRSITAGEMVMNEEIDFRLDDGSLATRLISSAPVRDSEGNITAGIVLIKDVTELKQAEKQILLANERLRYLLSSTAIVIYTTKASGDYRATFISDSITRMTGYGPREFTGIPNFWMDRIHPEDRPRILSGLPEINDKDFHLYEYRFRRKDGEFIWIADRVRLVYDREGKPLEFVGHMADITERKQAEQAIEDAREYTESILDTLNEALVVLDADLKVISANRYFYQIFKLSPEEIVDQSIFALGGVKWDSPELRKLLEEVISDNHTFNDFEIDRKFRGIGRRVLLHNGRRLYRKGSDQPMVLLAIQDITRRKQVEEDLLTYVRLATLGKLAGSISHEIRNPLATIDSSVYYLKAKLKNTDEKVQTHLERIHSSVGRSSAIIQSLMDLTRMREPQLAKVNLKAAIPGALVAVGIPGGVKIVKKFPEEEVMVNADHDQLGIVLQNIIANALQAMEGVGTLTITIRKLDRKAEVYFTDTGPGMSLEIQDKIFQPLFTTKAQGIGFGLCLVNMIVDKHNGTIEVKSKIGRGTTFIIRLPLFFTGVEAEKQKNQL